MTDEKSSGWELRTARDFNIPFAASLRSHKREPGLLSVMGHALWLGCVRAYLKTAHRLQVTGGAHLPADAPFVIVGNHTSHLDVLSLTASLTHRLAHRATALAAGDVFFRTTRSAMFAAAALNALPIWREETTLADLAFLRLRLMEDRMVFILFPEGTRARDGVMKRFRPGLGAFVAGTDIPVVPCFLTGAHACWPPQRRLPRPGPLHLAIGAPLRFDAVRNDPRGWKEVARQTEAAVRALGPALTAPGESPSAPPA